MRQAGRPAAIQRRCAIVDASGRQEVNDGLLPPGFLAIDLAHELNLPLYDPELQTEEERSGTRYVRVDPTLRGRQRRAATADDRRGAHRRTGRVGRPTDARVVVAQTSIYVPGNDRDLVSASCDSWRTQDYVGGLFVNDRFGQLPGTLR